MTHAAAVASNKVISIHYTLKNSAGDVLDTSEGVEPLVYLHGADNIVPGLEKALTGLAVGDHVDVAVSPEEGYGVRQDIPPKTIERDVLPPEMPLLIGMQLGIEGPDGHPIPIWIKAVDDDHVVLDFNHPLAGETLHFDVTIDEVRDATDAELLQGHPGKAHCCGDPDCSNNA